MSTVNGSDEVLVNRNNETYTQPQSTLMAKLEKTDLLLVNRDDQTYTVTGEDFIESVVDPILLEVAINPSTPTIGQAVTAIPVVSGGKAPTGGFVYTYQWYIADDAVGTNAAVLTGETSTTYTPVSSQAIKYVGCKVTTIDFFGESIEDTTYAGPVTSVQISPVIDSVTLTENFDAVNRYTSKEFPFTTAMATEGTPNPTYGLKTKLTGTTFDFTVKTSAITKVEPSGVEVCATELIESVSTNPVIYSDDCTWDPDGGGSAASNAFDNNTSTKWYTKTDTYSTWEPDGGIEATKFEIYMFRGSSYSEFTVNDQDASSVAGSLDLGEGWVDFSSFIVDGKINKVSGKRGNNSSGMSGFRINDQVLVDGDRSYTELTFPSDQGFDCFAKGDVVQGGNSFGITTNLISGSQIGTPEYLFNGVSSSPLSSNGFGCTGNGAEIEATFPNMDKTSGTLTVDYIIENVGSLTIYGPTGNWTVNTKTGTNVFTRSPDLAPFIGNKITKINITNDGGNVSGLSGIYYNNILQTEVDPVKVISKDDSNPYTITVDGGEWSDGTQYNYTELVETTSNSSLGLTPNPSVIFKAGDTASSYIGAYTTASFKLPLPGISGNILGIKNGPQGTSVSFTNTLYYKDGTNVSMPNSESGYNEVTLDGSKEVDYILIEGSASSEGTQGLAIYGLQIDGVQIVDTAASNGDNKLVKETPYDTILTLASSENLDVLTAGTSVKMGPAADVPYQPISDSIVSVADESAWSQNEVWSNSLTAVGDPYTFGGVQPLNAAAAFDGSDATYALWGATTGSSMTFNTNIENVTTVTIYCGTGSTTPATVQVNGLPAQTIPGVTGSAFTFTYSNPSTLTSVQVISGASDGSGSQRGLSINYIDVDGKRLVDQGIAGAPTTGNTTLTLSGDTDLAYFREGDVVQEDGSVIKNNYIEKPILTNPEVGNHSTAVVVNAFDGDETTKALPAVGNWWIFQMPNIPVTTSFKIWYEPGSSGLTWLKINNATIQALGGNGSGYLELNKAQWDAAGLGNTFDTLDVGYSTNQDYCYLKLIEIDGKKLVDSSKVPLFKVVSTDVSTKTITVDGGKWEGSDGSASGEAGWNQSQVWSSICTYVNGNTSRPLSLFFNGQLDQELYALSRKRATITFPSVVPATTGEIYGKINGATDSQWILEINGVEVTQGSDNDWTSIDTALAVEGGLKTISFGDNGSGTYPHIYGIKLDGKLLVDQGIAGAPIPGDPEVTCVSPLKAPTDWTIEGIDTDNNQLSLSHATPDDNAQVWVANDNQAGTDFYVEPSTAIPIQTTEAWGNLLMRNGQAEVTSIQKDDPGFVDLPDKDYTIKFPAQFGTGNAPDIDLPVGTSISAIVKATNSLGSSEKESNTLLPQAPNPDGVAGPITATTSTTLTVANSVNLDTFSPGDNLVMVDENNDISSYTIVSDSIVSVDSTTYDYTSYWTGTVIGKSGTTADAGMAFDDNVVSNYVYGNANQTITWTPPEPISYEDIKLYVSQSGYGGTVVVNNIDVTSAIQVYTGTTGVFFSKVQLEGLGVTSPLTSIAITSSSAQGNTPIMCGLEIDGRLLIDNDVQTTLTLASDQDLAYFRPGDAVQSTKEWNQDQVWSAAANYTGNVVSPEVAFNGLADSNPFGGTKASSGLVTWRPPSPVSFNTIKIIGWANSDAQGLQINDTLVMGVDASGISYKTLENDDLVAKGITSPLKSISFAIAGGVGSGFYAVYLDGKLLVDEGIAGDPGSEVKVISIDETVPSITVDGGEWAGTDGSGDPGWNQDQVWSDDVINDRAGYPATNAFDGSLSTVAYADAGKTTTVTFASAIPVDKLRINVSKSGAGTTGIVLNGTNYVAEQIGGNGWNTITGVTFLESISYTSTSNNDFIGIYQIEVNGKLLVDQGVAGAPTAGDTEVTTAPVTGTGVFASTNGTDEITLSTSNDRWIDNNNRLSKNFYVRDNITVLNADNPKHVAMQQAIADAFTAFPQKVNERRTSIASSFYRLMAGEAVSAAELQLLEDTVTDAVNAQEPFALDGYYPLYYTSEKADAASSVNAHHTHTINGIEYYMPDGGTLYHGTYTS